MKFKKAIISLSLLGGLLPQASFGMDPVVDVPGGTVPRKPSIVIPSDPNIVGMKEIEFPTPEMKRSWKNLNSFTNQTIDNLCRGAQGGICYVHSLEDIMGATDCFTKNWNLHHPHDQRYPEGENFHKVFTHQEYVDHYIPYVLAHRPLIAGSILAFNDEPAFTLSDSFSPVSFIMHVPAECIGLIDRRDAGTPVAFLHQKDEQKLKRFASYLENRSEALTTLDALLRYPFFQTRDNVFFPVMNEVAILNCAIDGGNVHFKPSIIGVLFNPSYGSVKCDYGNASRNVEWKAAAEEFCTQQKLPFLTLEGLKTVSKEEAENTVVQEWFGNKKSLELYEFHRYPEGEGNPEDLCAIKDKTFLLSEEQLNGYGLKR